uniref:CCHC-type domain-containing protein n=1 Tax=Sipha flava TaxID=143950 RepID=A0A2S2QHG6_9HEMI
MLKVMCYSCEKIGHLASLCPVRTCHSCYLTGHSARNCPGRQGEHQDNNGVLCRPMTLLLASSLPANLLALERTRIRRRKEEAGPTVPANTIKKEERPGAWQHRWDRSTKGR